MSDIAPPFVIPYATALVFDRSRYLRSGLRFGLAANLLAAAYLAAWLVPLSYDIRYGASRWAPIVQAVFIGAGAAFTIIARQRPGIGHSWRWYLLVFTVNVLAIASLALELSGVMEYRITGIHRYIAFPI